VLQLHGDELLWEPKELLESSALRFKILENNEVGIVAAAPHAYADRSLGRIIGFEAIVIDKASGRMRLGNMGMPQDAPSRDGECHKL